jgi:hypothetical protein
MDEGTEVSEEELVESLRDLRASVVSRTARPFVRASALDSQNALPSGLLADRFVRTQLLALGSVKLTAAAAPIGALRGWGGGKGAVLLTYLARCALRQGDVTSQLGAPGRLGLAADWSSRKLDDSEQRWMTACLMAHTNNLARVEIALSGTKPTDLGSRVGGTVAPQHFAIEEAAFYGNIFTPNAALFACGGDGAAAACHDRGVGADLQRRICGTANASTCGFRYIGPCNTSAADGTPRPGVCQVAMPYASCRDSGGTHYAEVVTASLRTDAAALELAPSCWNGSTPTSCTSPPHDECVIGSCMRSDTRPEVTAVCARDSYCCTTAWDSSCVEAARNAGFCP